LVTQGILRPSLSTNLPTFPFNVLTDRPVETTWVLRPEDWKGQVPSRKTTTINWVSSLLVSILTGNDLTKKTRHAFFVTFPLPPIVRTRENELVRLDHLTDELRREKKTKTKKH
jgi:hypothetical protein